MSGPPAPPAAAPPRPLTAPDVVASLLADVAERDERLAEVTAERNRIAESCASTAAELATCREHNAAIAVQLDQYRDERDELAAELERMRHDSWAKVAADRDDARTAFAKLAARFTQGAQSGWTARISGTVLRRLCVMAGCEPPPGSDVPDEASELARIHATLLEEILRNADDDIKGADEAAEYLAEAWVRFLESDRERLQAELARIRGEATP